MVTLPSLPRWPWCADPAAMNEADGYDSGGRLDATDRRVMRWLGGFLFAYYLLTLGGHQYSIDGIVAFQTAKSLLFRHAMLLDPPVHWCGDIRCNYVGVLL